MKITIDTQHDTMDDIQKIVHILTNILERKGSSTLSVPSSAAADTTPLMSMFTDELPKLEDNATALVPTKARPVYEEEEAKIEFY